MPHHPQTPGLSAQYDRVVGQSEQLPRHKSAVSSDGGRAVTPNRFEHLQMHGKYALEAVWPNMVFRGALSRLSPQVDVNRRVKLATS